MAVGRVMKDLDPVTIESYGLLAQSVKWKLGTRKRKSLFKLCMNSLMPDEVNVSSSTVYKGITKSNFWHLRLGYIGHGGLDSIVRKTTASKSTSRLCRIGRRVMGVLWQANASELNAKVSGACKEDARSHP